MIDSCSLTSNSSSLLKGFPMAIPPESELGPLVPKIAALASASLLLLGTKLEDDLPSDVDKEKPVSFDWLFSCFSLKHYPGNGRHAVKA